MFIHLGIPDKGNIAKTKVKEPMLIATDDLGKFQLTKSAVNQLGLEWKPGKSPTVAFVTVGGDIHLLNSTYAVIPDILKSTVTRSGSFSSIKFYEPIKTAIEDASTDGILLVETEDRNFARLLFKEI